MTDFETVLDFEDEDLSQEPEYDDLSDWWFWCDCDGGCDDIDDCKC